MKYFLSICATFLVLVGPATAQNLVTNPGFESGTTGWTTCSGAKLGCTFHVPNQHSGADALCNDGCCGNWGEDTGGWQDVGSLVPGMTYDISGWTKGCDDVADTGNYPVGATVGYGGACGAPPTTIIGTNTDCTYTQYATTISGVSSVRFYFYAEPHANWSPASVHWDDAILFGSWADVSSVGDWVLYD